MSALPTDPANANCTAVLTHDERVRSLSVRFPHAHLVQFAELMRSGLVEETTFKQIEEMDDDGDDLFSRQIVCDFFEQADSTFKKMEDALCVHPAEVIVADCRRAQKDALPILSDLGHFLKGSSATLGLIHVRDSCEKIQHYGSKKDATGNHDEPDEAKCLRLLTTTIKEAKKEFKAVEKVLRHYYGMDEAA
jgi:osomolarity two-component system phosphorelay intermediate protein YPD1